MIKKLKRRIRSFLLSDNFDKIRFDIEVSKLLNSKILINQIKSLGKLNKIQDAEFSVFSQYGDDGIIQYLINTISIESKSFIEFGVQDYTESNTRFLLINNNWRGLIIDGSNDHIEFVKKDNIYWKYDLTAIASFITRKNINELFQKNNFTGEIGLLSIDIDGNDYWIWDCINSIQPIIVIAEYNSVFGDRHSVTVPYNDSFVRSTAHSSNLYWGASLSAFINLSNKKGYSFIGSNSAGNNAYFIRNDKAAAFKVLSIKEGYVESRYRESRNKLGQLTYISGKDRLNEIKDCEVYDVEKNELITINKLINN
jgi:hypothetical protein